MALSIRNTAQEEKENVINDLIQKIKDISQPNRKPYVEETLGPKVDYILCLPGDPSSGDQAAHTSKIMLDMIKNGHRIGECKGYGSDIFAVRNLCLRETSNRKDQLPFQGMFPDYKRTIWIDGDNIVTSAQVTQLLSHDVDIVAGWCRAARYPKDNTDKASCGRLKYVNNEPGKENFYDVVPFTVGDMLQYANDKEVHLIKVGWTGFPFICIKRGVFEDIGYPWFMPWTIEWEVEGIQLITHIPDDIGFCIRAQQKGYIIHVDPHCRVVHQKMTST